MSSRRRSLGHTLVELLIVMSTGSAMLVLAIGMIHQSMTISSRSEKQANHHRAYSRLAMQLRDDIRASVRCRVEGNELELTSPHGKIVFRHEGSEVTRLTRIKDRDQRNRYPTFTTILC